MKTIRQFINKSGNDVRHTIAERERDDKFKKEKKNVTYIFVYIAHPIFFCFVLRRHHSCNTWQNLLYNYLSLLFSSFFFFNFLYYWPLR